MKVTIKFVSNFFTGLSKCMVRLKGRYTSVFAEHLQEHSNIALNPYLQFFLESLTIFNIPN